MNWQAIKTIARDIGSLVVGFGGIVYQQLTHDVNPWLLGAYMAMLSLPGAISLVQLGRGTGSPTTPPTPASSSPSPSSSSSSSQ